MSDEMVEFVQTGVSIIIATRNARLAPAIARATAVMVDNPSEIALVLSTAGARSCIDNLRDNSYIALCMADPVGYRSVQFKGRCRAIEAIHDGALERSEQWRDLFAKRCAHFGLTPTQVRNLWVEGDCVIRMSISAAYDQTPGPGAGGAMEATSSDCP